MLALAGVLLLVDLGVIVANGLPLADLVTLAVPISFLAVGWLIIRRYPEHVEGRLLFAIGLAWAAILVLPFDGGWVIPVGLMGTHLLLRYPDGRLPSARWRWFSRWCTLMIIVLTVVITTSSRITSQGVTNPYYVPPTRFLVLLILALPLCLLISVWSVIVRYRRSSMVSRTQIRWLAAAASVILLVYCITLASSFIYDARNQHRQHQVELVRAALPHLAVNAADVGAAFIPADPRGVRDRDPALPPVRHRPNHQPDYVLRHCDRAAACDLRDDGRDRHADLGCQVPTRGGSVRHSQSQYWLDRRFGEYRTSSTGDSTDPATTPCRRSTRSAYDFGTRLTRVRSPMTSSPS